MDTKQLQQAMPRLAKNKVRFDTHYPHLVSALEEADITTPLRLAAYLAQISHESHELRYMSEVWGPTPQQLKYERPRIAGKLAPLATTKPFPLWQRLGNTEPGDGFAMRGAGPIQLTGRENFRLAGLALGLDLIGNPDLARTPEVGHRLGGYFWTSRKLNALADAQNFDAITLKINGGYNGKAERDAYYRTNLRIFGA